MVDWYDPAWRHRKAIVIDSAKVAGSLAGFPVLISLAEDAELAHGAQAEGQDILFPIRQPSAVPCRMACDFCPIVW